MSDRKRREEEPREEEAASVRQRVSDWREQYERDEEQRWLEYRDPTKVLDAILEKADQKWREFREVLPADFETSRYDDIDMAMLYYIADEVLPRQKWELAALAADKRVDEGDLGGTSGSIVQDIKHILHVLLTEHFYEIDGRRVYWRKESAA